MRKAALLLHIRERKAHLLPYNEQNTVALDAESQPYAVEVTHPEEVWQTQNPEGTASTTMHKELRDTNRRVVDGYIIM